MAADSDGCSVKTVVTCEGDLADPRFPGQLGRVLSELQAVLGVRPKVHKLEPWNSVRVTLSIPREAALRLRQLANNGAHLLRSLGILSVQVEGDQVISLRLATPNSQEPQEIIFRTAVQDGNDSGGDNNSLSQILAGAVEATQAAAMASAVSSSAAAAAAAATAAACAQSVPTSDKVQFRSPNVVCPADSIVPKVPNNSSNSSSSIGINGGLSLPASNAAAAAAAAATAAASIASAGPSTGPFPFTSMNQAIHTHRNLSNTISNNTVLHPVAVVPLPIVTNNSAATATITNSISASNNSNSVPLNVTSTTVLAPPPPPPPPYPGIPGVHPPVTLSSPLLVNLLQNEGGTISKPTSAPSDEYKQQQQQIHVASVATLVVTRPNHALMSVSDTKSVVANNNVLHHHRQLQHQQQQQQSQHNNMAKMATSSAFTSASAKDNITTSNCVMLNSPCVSSPVPSVSQFTNGNDVHHSGSIDVMVAQAANSASISGRSPVPYRSYPAPLPPPPPPPPAYPTTSTTTTTVQRPSSLWDQQQQQQSMDQQLQDLTPSLTDLKEVDLVHLLPTLESDLAGSPLLDLPDDLICSTEIKPPPHGNYLINPLTGELEPHHASEAEEDETLQDVFTGLPSPAALLSDEDTNSTIRPDTTDQSDSESRSGHHSSDSSKPQRIKRSKDKGHRSDSPNVSKQSASKAELKLRFKLEKSEPVAAAYKVDYINPNQQKKGTISLPTVSSTDEPRVPPLHISLRGRNHVVISNKKKVKLNSDGTPMKVKQRTKLFVEQQKLKKTLDEGKNLDDTNLTESNLEIGKKSKRPKLIHDMDLSGSTNLQDPTAMSIPDKLTAVYNLHYKEKLKERRGSDSELVKINSISGNTGNNGLLNNYKKRRLSQSSELEESLDPRDSIMPVLGSTNTGTVSSISNHKQRKFKLKDLSIRMRDASRFKSYNMKTIDKMKQTVVLPTGEIDMEAKFKQRLLEEQTDRRGTSSAMSTSHKATTITSASTVVTSSMPTSLTSSVVSTLHNDSATANSLVTAKRAVVIVEEQKRLVVDDLLQTLEQNTSSPPPLKDKPPPEPDKCNTPDQQHKVKTASVDAGTGAGTGNAGSGAVPGSAGNNAAVNANGNVVSRSPNGGAQGEDSGIESMDALSEKSPNQASQSPHGELPETSTTISSNNNHNSNSAVATATSAAAMQCIRGSSNLVSTPTSVPNNTPALTVLPSAVCTNKMIVGGVGNNSGSISAKSQVPIMLDIEAQLAKMEGLNGADDDVDDDDDDEELEEEEEDEEDDDEDDDDDEDEEDEDLQHLVDGDLADDPNENNALIKVDKLSDKQQCCRPPTATTTITTTTGTTSSVLDNRKHVVIMQTNNDGNQVKNKLCGEETIRIAPPPRYTYSSSATEKDRNSSSPPPLHLTSDNNSNIGSTNINTSSSVGTTHPYKGSLLKQLLIDIPDSNHHHHHSTRSNSPSTTSTTTSTSATTISTPSVRTRAASKLNSPELNSPVGSTTSNRQRVLVSTVGPASVIHTMSSVATTVTAKRKRYESDGSTSNHSAASIDDAATNRLKKVRKHSENTAEFIKSCIGTDSKRKKVPEESSDDEQPLIEMAKSKKGPPTPTLSSLSHITGAVGGLTSVGGSVVAGMTPRVKLKSMATTATASGTGGAATTAATAALMNSALASKIGPINTRRSIRAIPALNTRSKGDKTNLESDILRRKTRSAVSEGEGKRRKDIK